MAKEQKQQIELVTVEIEQSKIEAIRETNNKLNELVNAFGQLYIRNKELEEELQRLEEAKSQAEEDFQAKNKEMRELITELEVDYPRGQLDLQEGTVTYNPAIKEQMAAQAASPAESDLKVVNK